MGVVVVGQVYKGPSNAMCWTIQHPRCGAGHKYRTMYLSLQSSCGETLAKVSGNVDTPAL